MKADDTKREHEASGGGAPINEKDLAEVCAQFADVCQYFSQQNMDLPPQILAEVPSVSKLAIPDRVARMKRLNQELMEYLHACGPGRQIRQ